MKKCPDREKLYLFLDKELSAEESAGFHAHIQKCVACQKELKACQDNETFLKQKVNEAFSLCQSREKIIAQIKNDTCNATHDPVAKPAVPAWIFRPLGLAFAILLVVALFLITQKASYRGSVGSISVQALGADSYADGRLLMPGSEMALNKAEKVRLSGHFLFTLPDIDASSFSVNGSTDVIVKKAKPVFSDAELEMLWVSGSGCEIDVNGKIVRLNAGSADPVKVGARLEPISMPQSSGLKEENPLATDSACPDILISVPNTVRPVEMVETETVEAGCASETVSADRKPEENSVYNKSPFAEEPVLPLNGN